MGYACPVCDVPQQDGEHLANHLAFTAMLRDDDHADWLADNVPGWADADPATLADRVTPLAEEATYDAVFEDTSDAGRPPVDAPDAGHGHGDHAGHEHGHGHDHAGHEHDGAHDAGHGGSAGGRGPSGVGDVLQDARELTRRMHADTETGDESDDAETTSDESEADATDTDESE